MNAMKDGLYYCSSDKQHRTRAQALQGQENGAMGLFLRITLRAFADLLDHVVSRPALAGCGFNDDTRICTTKKYMMRCSVTAQG